MKEKEHNEDDENKKKSESENSDYFEDNDEFGLPEMQDAEEPYQKEDEPNETFASEDYSSDRDYASDPDDSDYTYNEEEEYEEAPAENKSYYVHGLDDDDDDERKGPGTGLIVFLVILFLLGIGFGVWYFILRTPEPPAPITKPVESVAPDTTFEEPEPEPEPIIKDDPTSIVAGTVTQLNSSTGRYYVIIASFIDDDLGMDYGKKLAKQGVGTTLLAPKSARGFYRLAIADFVSLQDAAVKAEEAKSTYGNNVWVLRY